MAPLSPNDQARRRRRGDENNNNATDRALEERVRALEAEIKMMRASFDKEIKSLREELRQHQHDAGTVPRAVAYPVDSVGSSCTDPVPLPVSNSRSRETAGGTGEHRGAGPAGGDAIVASVEEASKIVGDLTWIILQQNLASDSYESSKRAFDNAPSSGLTKEQARRNMLVKKESLDETKRATASRLKSAKDRVSTLQQVVGSEFGANANPLDGTDHPIEVLQQLYDFVDDYERSVQTSCDASTTNTEGAEVLNRKQMEFINNLQWSQLRLKKAKRAAESHE